MNRDSLERGAFVDEIAYRLRKTIKEFGRGSVESAVIVGGYDAGPKVAGIEYIHCPTFSGVTLGTVPFKVARFFEDIADYAEI